MPVTDDEWLLERSNIRRLARGADNTSENESLPEDLQREFRDLENQLRQIERLLRRYDM